MAKRNVFSAVVCGATLVSGLVSVPVFAESPVDISIIEVVDDGAGGYKDWEDITGAMPGATYSAIPRVKNNGLATVATRMCLSESATNANGETIMLPSNTFGIVINEHWVLDIESSSDAADPASGNCYKYNMELRVGDVTEPLFTEVTLSSELGNEYGGATFNLHLYAEATGDLPDKPDTGAATLGGSSIKADYIFYGLGAAAIFVFILHLILGLVKRK